MAIIKCKMCGGDLELIPGQSVAECEYCGSRQTVPVADNDKKMTLFARANRLRAACEFDKAAGVYESIVAEFPEEAEAYWGLVLCKYGIEYVDDPATGKKIPTCHRSSFDSILEDSDFEQALENADVVARKQYREEAKQIEEIRKGIIAVSANEQPYDIFICYKETDENGERTLDSVLAQDIYDALTAKNYRVFFSRITLEDKLGLEYEPYIFAALNSAKIMLAVGTDYEYYNAVWVKNEWSRYLKLMAKDKDKHLIPCYKGIDAYDMPKEFARLQAQDLGKVGAMQDLLRGVEKVLQKDQPVTAQGQVVVNSVGGNKIASLLDRGNMALEDGDWNKAMSFFEDVLNNDSKNAQAYLGETLAQEQCHFIEEFIMEREYAGLTICGETLTLEPNTAHIAEIVEKYQIPGYCEEHKLRSLYDFDLSYHSEVAERKAQYHAEECYWADHKQLSRAEKFATGDVAKTLQQEKQALFAALKERIEKAEQAEAKEITYLKESYAAHIRQADEQAEALYQNAVALREQNYQRWLNQAKEETIIWKLNSLASRFYSLNGYADSKALADHCRKRAEEEQAKGDKEAERIAKRNKRIAVICTAVAAVALAVFPVVTQIIVPNTKYNDAVALMEAGNVVEAYEALIALDGYKDSSDKAKSIYVKYEAEKVKNAKVGDYVVFGTYEQDNNKSNGKEDIEWLVLEIKDGKALVVSKYALDCQQYNTERTSATWETCSLRQWLNKDFLNAAFSTEEQAMIPSVTISADKNPSYSTDPGKATQDKVFLLSIQEANKYFASNSDRQCAPTDYAVANGAYVKGNCCWWWLRSPGPYQTYAASVSGDGGVLEFGRNVNNSSGAVRPALWIDLGE